MATMDAQIEPPMELPLELPMEIPMDPQMEPPMDPPNYLLDMSDECRRWNEVYRMNSAQCELVVAQQPKIAKQALELHQKNRQPIDPPPMCMFTIPPNVDFERSYITSPNIFCTVSLHQPNTEEGGQRPEAALLGVTTSSIHPLRGYDQEINAYFIFPELYPKLIGDAALRFDVFERRDDSSCHHLSFAISDTFRIYGKGFPGLLESTPLTRYFADQGLKIRLRQQPKNLLRKGGPADENYAPRTYNRKKNNKRDRKKAEEDGMADSPNSSQAEQQGSMDSTRASNVAYAQAQEHFGAYDGSYEERPDVKRPRSTLDLQQEQGYAYGHSFHEAMPHHQNMAVVGHPQLIHTQREDLLSLQQAQEHYHHPVPHPLEHRFNHSHDVNHSHQDNHAQQFPSTSSPPNPPLALQQSGPPRLQQTNPMYSLQQAHQQQHPYAGQLDYEVMNHGFPGNIVDVGMREQEQAAPDYYIGIRMGESNERSNPGP